MPVVFADGDFSSTVRLSIPDDDIAEGVERFTVSLTTTNPAVDVRQNNVAMVSIIDNDSKSAINRVEFSFSLCPSLAPPFQSPSPPLSTHWILQHQVILLGEKGEGYTNTGSSWQNIKRFSIPSPLAP